MQPVTHIAPVPVDRERLALNDAGNDQWNQFFLELVRAVVVRAVADRGREPVGVVIGPHQVVGGCLAGGVGGIGRIGRGFGERRVIRAQRAVHLIGRYVVEPVPWH